MKAILKALILLIAASQIGLSVKAEIFHHVTNTEHPNSLEELNNIKKNIKNELKALKESLKYEGDKASIQLKNTLQELQKAKYKVENQIDQSIKPSHQFSPQETQLKEIKPVALKIAKEDYTPERDIPEKDPEIEEEDEEKNFTTKKIPQKKVCSKFSNGIKRRPGLIKNFFTKIFSTVKKTDTRYEINEYQSDDKKKYFIIVTMPNIVEEQVQIAIHETLNGHYGLTILAQTHPAKIVTHENRENSLTQPVTQQILEPTFVNGECRYFHYYNGTLEVAVNLPHNVKHDTYSLEFLDHALKIEFEQV